MIRRKIVGAVLAAAFVIGLAGMAGPGGAEDGICGGVGHWDPVLQDCVD